MDDCDETETLRAACNCDDLMTETGIPSVLFSEKCGKTYGLSSRKCIELTPVLRQQMFQLLQATMKEMYQSTWGWDEAAKQKELFAPDARYLILSDQSKSEEEDFVGFVMYKFEWDDMDVPEHPVLFCYDLHLDSKYRSLGLGKKLMELLLRFALHFRMWKTMLTCFKINETAMNFYRNIGFEIDANSPSSCGYDEEVYEILSDKPLLK